MMRRAPRVRFHGEQNSTTDDDDDDADDQDDIDDGEKVPDPREAGGVPATDARGSGLKRAHSWSASKHKPARKPLSRSSTPPYLHSEASGAHRGDYQVKLSPKVTQVGAELKGRTKRPKCKRIEPVAINREGMMEEEGTSSSSSSTSTSSTSSDTDADEEPVKLLGARTAIVLDYSYDNPAVNSNVWTNALLQRSIIDKETGERIPVWRTATMAPQELAELAPRFRARCGFNVSTSDHPARRPHDVIFTPPPNKQKTAQNQVWCTRMLKLSRAAKRILFPNGKAHIWGLQKKDSTDITEEINLVGQKPRGLGTNTYERVACEVILKTVKLLICPLGACLLIFYIDWNTTAMPSHSEAIYNVATLEDLRTWLFLALFRQEVENVTLGWSFPSDDVPIAHFGMEDRLRRLHPDREEGEVHKEHEDIAELKKALDEQTRLWPHFDDHLSSLGRLSHQIYEGQPLSIGVTASWLIHLPGEDDFFPPPRINSGQRSHHHTIVVLNHKPPKSVLKEYIYDLRRAHGQLNRPQVKKKMKKGSKGSDKVLVERVNRYIGLSPEGVVCLTWPIDQVTKDYCVKVSPAQFLGIYLLLALQANAERAVLQELFNESSELAEYLDAETKSSLIEMSSYRLALRQLATKMVQYTVSMSSDNCGGRPEYSYFFYNIRKVFRIPSAKFELREIIDDILGIVEASYSEEQKKTKAQELKLEREKIKQKKRQSKTKERRGKVFELCVTSTAAISLPIMVVSGLFGMNMSDAPDPGFWPVLLIASATSVALLLILFLIYCMFIADPLLPWFRRKRGLVSGAHDDALGLTQDEHLSLRRDSMAPYHSHHSDQHQSEHSLDDTYQPAAAVSLHNQARQHKHHTIPTTTITED
eukprot:TRINITY_DN4042_c0_g1_i7.p1 TRINITY_DN4042_c0_g1~~TRINITY_DN4042_c0_g1_i7.p1  ORF type:complete len:872 (+),score=98.62 TRINITY_DN4042_c0_g1_i7:179-2794(+)